MVWLAIAWSAWCRTGAASSGSALWRACRALIATDGGLARLNPKGQLTPPARMGGGGDSVPLFTVYQPDKAKGKLVNVLFEDLAGIVWVGTAGGLYQMEAQGEHVGFRAVALSD